MCLRRRFEINTIILNVIIIISLNVTERIINCKLQNPSWKAYSSSDSNKFPKFMVGLLQC